MVHSQKSALLLVIAACSAFLVSPSWAEVPTEFQPKYDNGYELGYPLGYKWGLADGKKRGWEQGAATGKTEGYDDGWDAAYSPAFDLAYDKRFPVGHLAGWKDGVSEGFDKGFDYAPVVAAQIFNNWSSGNLTITTGGWWGSGGTGVILTSVNTWWTGIESSDYTVWRNDLSYDWSKHYFDLGFEDGKTEGFSVGTDEGYDLVYPKGYAFGYRVGHIDGVNVGTTDGTRDGRKQGYDDGWDEGYDGGFDEGFYAGIDYHLFGEFAEPKYSFHYMPRSNAFTAQTLVALHAPEPTSLMLVGGAGVGTCLARRKRRD